MSCYILTVQYPGGFRDSIYVRGHSLGHALRRARALYAGCRVTGDGSVRST